MGGVLDAAGGAWAVALRAIVFAASVVALGAAAFRLFVWPRAGRDPLAARIAAGMGAGACGVLFVAAGPRLWVEAMSFVDPGDPVLPMTWNVLHTEWGRGLVAQAAGALCGLAGFTLVGRSRLAGGPLVALACAAIVTAPALMGHAIAAPRFTVLDVAVDLAHVASAGAWIGALVVLTAAVFAFGRDNAVEAVARHIDAFHPLALRSAAVLVLTGTTSAALRLGRFANVVATPYGRLLLLKVAVVAVVLALGWRHSRTAAALARSGSGRRVARSLAVEVGFAALVIAVTAILVGTSPDGTMPG